MYRNYDWKKIVYDKLSPLNSKISNSSQCPDGSELKGWLLMMEVITYKRAVYFRY
jgi:hypothetical protein